jgi:hypothetical protein
VAIIFSHTLCFPEIFDFEQNQLKMTNFHVYGSKMVGNIQTQNIFWNSKSLSVLVTWIMFISKIHESMVIWSCNITFWRQIFVKTTFFVFTKIIKHQQMFLWKILEQIFSWDPAANSLPVDWRFCVRQRTLASVQFFHWRHPFPSNYQGHILY